jgi:hypothetical protein
LIIGAAIAVGLTAAVVHAALAVPTFNTGDTLQAASLTQLSTDITNLDTRLTAAEAALAASPTPWATYPCSLVDFSTGTAVGNNTSKCLWRRVGDSIDVQGYTIFTATPGGAGAGGFSYTLPQGLSVDTSKLPYGSGNRNTLGTGLAALNAGALGELMYVQSVAGKNQFAINTTDTTGLSSTNPGIVANTWWSFVLTVPVTP